MAFRPFSGSLGRRRATARSVRTWKTLPCSKDVIDSVLLPAFAHGPLRVAVALLRAFAV